MKVNKKIDAGEFDSLFERGDDIADHLDLTSARRPGREALAEMLKETRAHLLDEVAKIDRMIQKVEGKVTKPRR